ncbi:RNA-binding CRS1 / YhbY (CRM) domain protein [Melia azedarach]|uniref:RNA-binding CRS1 / YhbY (CRM) domain protein n=1 Tax=Melia azedarach TaxID=155640 RepID=A0ACC1XZ31_MELAZ|nr:RNA-binding CRS1 / YhbY (CRM) domain protein [Melia azedarach]
MAATITCLLRPLCISTTSAILSKYPLRKPHFSSLSTPSLLFPLSFSSLTPSKASTPTLSFPQLQEQQGKEEERVVESVIQESVVEEEYETENVEKEENISVGSGPAVKVPKLTVKEKKELASYAHSLGKKLKCQLVGKNGVTDGVVSSFIENLESNELLKIKIHRTCPGELEDVVKQLEEATGSVVVGQIGRTIIVYRPSLTKLKSEEKKKQARKVFVRNESQLKPVLQKAQVWRLSGRGRRGNSRFSTPASS